MDITDVIGKLVRLSTGKRTGDIELPNESGKVDPRIDKEDVYERMRKGMGVVNSNPILRGK